MDPILANIASIDRKYSIVIYFLLFIYYSFNVYFTIYFLIHIFIVFIYSHS